mgnify:CR=1 FL=1
MSNNRNKLFLLSIASLPLFGGDLFGMTGTPLMPAPQAVITKATVTKKDAGMRLGPSETYTNIGKYRIPVSQVQEDTPMSHTMCQAIRLPASLLNKYVGFERFADNPIRFNLGLNLFNNRLNRFRLD